MGSKANFQQENKKREKNLSGDGEEEEEEGEEGGESRVQNSPKAFGELKKSIKYYISFLIRHHCKC